MRTIAIAMQKGGVGKTTSSLALGAILAERDKRVLLVDCDSQCHLTEGSSVDVQALQDENKPTVFDVLVHRVPAARAIIPPDPPTRLFSLLPGSPFSATVDGLLSGNAVARDLRLKLALQAVADDYDYVVIDCPPNLGLLTLNALMAATDVLIPTQTHQMSLSSLPSFLATIYEVRDTVSPDLNILGVLPTMFDRRNSHDRKILEALPNFIPEGFVFDPVRLSTRFKEAFSLCRPIHNYDRDASEAYERLADHIGAAA